MVHSQDDTQVTARNTLCKGAYISNSTFLYKYDNDGSHSLSISQELRKKEEEDNLI